MIPNLFFTRAAEAFAFSNPIFSQTQALDKAVDILNDDGSLNSYGLHHEGKDRVVARKDVAKELDDWVKKFDGFTFKGAYMDGSVVGAEGAKSLVKMKSRVELQGDVVMLAQSPGRNIAGEIAGQAGAIAGCVKSLIEKLEEAA